MHIVFLNRAFHPDFEATGQLLTELTEDLSRTNDVTVVCGRPTFVKLRGRVFPWRLDSLGRVRVLRVWGTLLPKRIPAARALNLATFYLLAKVCARRVPRADVVVSLTDPPFLGLLGASLARRSGCPFVLYCQDLYPDVAHAVGMAPRVLGRWFERVQRRILAGANVVIALGDDMARRLTLKGVPADRIRVIRNWVDTKSVYPLKERNAFRRRHTLDGKVVVMYSGNFGYVWDLDSVLEAAAAFKNEPRVHFVLVGGGSLRPAVERRVAEDGLRNVLLLPYQPREELAQSLSAADLHLVPMRSCVYGTMVPSKIYGILASGTPLAALAEEDSEVADVIRAHSCGWRGNPGDVSALVSAIRSVLEAPEAAREMGLNGRLAAERYYDRARLTAAFQAVVEGLDDTHSSRRVSTGVTLPSI